MPRNRASLVTVLTGLALILFAHHARAGAQGATARGEQVYAAQKCSVCHAIAGAGNKKFPLDGVGKKLSADQIREWIVTPLEAAKKANSTAKPAMKAYPNLSKEDLDALVAFMKSLAK